MMKFGDHVSKAPALRALLEEAAWSDSPSFHEPLQLSEAVEIKVLLYELSHAGDAALADEQERMPAAAEKAPPLPHTPPLVPANGRAPSEPPPSPPPLSPAASAAAREADSGPLPVHDKTPSQLERLSAAAHAVLLFRQLSSAQLGAVLDAMFERRVGGGETVITQGDEGDFFYVVEAGLFDVFVHPPDDPSAAKKVTQYGPGGTFGELALLTQRPRAATVVCSSPDGGRLWALGRAAFVRVLQEATRRQRAAFGSALSSVPLLAQLDPYDLSALSDTLVASSFSDGEAIVRQGDRGDALYIVLEGQAVARIAAKADDAEDSARRGGANGGAAAAVAAAGVHGGGGGGGARLGGAPAGDEREVARYTQGGFFGEVSLLRDEPRAASVYALGFCRVAAVGAVEFKRLLDRPLRAALEGGIGGSASLPRAAPARFVR